jgi:hypothetical protein
VQYHFTKIEKLNYSSVSDLFEDEVIRDLYFKINQLVDVMNGLVEHQHAIAHNLLSAKPVVNK